MRYNGAHLTPISQEGKSKESKLSYVARLFLPTERKKGYFLKKSSNISVKVIFGPTRVRRNQVPYLDDLGAFYYLLVVGHGWRTSASRYNIGPLWGNQVPEPRERE